MKRYISKKTDVKASKSSPSLHSAFDGLDDRFSFDLDDTFEIDVDTKLITCYKADSKVIGNGAGVEYKVVVPMASEDVHWQTQERVERALDEYFSGITDGSDYTFSVISVAESREYDYAVPDAAFDCDQYVYYFVGTIEVVPYQNISPWGDYGIDYGTEEWLDSYLAED